MRWDTDYSKIRKNI